MKQLARDWRVVPSKTTIARNPIARTGCVQLVVFNRLACMQRLRLIVRVYIQLSVCYQLEQPIDVLDRHKTDQPIIGSSQENVISYMPRPIDLI